MLTTKLRNNLDGIADDLDIAITEIYQLEKRIKYDGIGVDICDGLDDARSSIQEAINTLADVDGTLSFMLRTLRTEIEEDDNGK